MTGKFWLSTAAALCLAGAASAQGFEGAYVGAEALAYGDRGDFGATTYSAGLQFGFGYGVGIGADFSYYGFDTIGLDARNATVHGIYALNPITSAGLFFGQDSLEGQTAEVYGIEGQGSFGGTTVEGYFGQVDGDLLSGSMYGLSGSLMLGSSLGLSGSYGVADIDDQTSRVALGAQYQMGFGPLLYAEMGRINGDLIDEDYLALGVKLSIGPNGGTTFGSRSIYDIISGN